MTNCEFCKSDIVGTYGSGRFCNKQCASAFSTAAKRAEINQKVSDIAKIKNFAGKLQTPSAREKRNQTMLARYGTLLFVADRSKSTQSRMKRLNAKPFEQLCLSKKRRVLIDECNNTCSWCKNSEWLGKLINLEVDHIDGDRTNNDRSNLRILCPNCHSYTDTYKGKNIKKISKTEYGGVV